MQPNWRIRATSLSPCTKEQIPANVRMESTIRWVIPMLIAMFGVMLLVIAFPQLALWLPAKLGY